MEAIGLHRVGGHFYRGILYMACAMTNKLIVDECRQAFEAWCDGWGIKYNHLVGGQYEKPIHTDMYAAFEAGYNHRYKHPEISQPKVELTNTCSGKSMMMTGRTPTLGEIPVEHAEFANQPQSTLLAVDLDSGIAITETGVYHPTKTRDNG